MSKIRTYHELKQIPTFEGRFNYLKLSGTVGEDTFGHDRYLNQRFYSTPEWQHLRNKIIARDLGCDLGIPGRELDSGIHIHHMNPIGTSDIIDRTEYLTNPEYLICVSGETHRAIHYGDGEALPRDPVQRTPGDTCPWKHLDKEAQP